MKFGGHIFLWTERWSNDTLYLIDNARDLGLDCLDISIGDDIEFDPARIRKRAESAGVEITISPGNLWPFKADISHDDPEFRELGMVWHKKWLSKAGEAGVKAYSGALYAHPGRIELRKPSADEFKYAAENLHALAEYASVQGIKLVIEAMSHFRTHLVNTPRQMVMLAEKADHDNLKLLLDTYHMVNEIRDYAQGIELMAGRLWGIHPCENNRGVPGSGFIPWDEVFSALIKINFSGYMIFESYNSSVRNGEFAFSRGMFHNVCSDGNEFVKKGMKFIKEGLGIK